MLLLRRPLCHQAERRKREKRIVCKCRWLTSCFSLLPPVTNNYSKMWKAHLWVPVVPVVELCNSVSGGQKLGVPCVGTTWSGGLCRGR